MTSDSWVLVLTAAGACVTTTGALWLMFGFSPDKPRFKDDGLLYPGRQESKVVPSLLRAQRIPGGMTAIGAAIQLLAAVIALTTPR